MRRQTRSPRTKDRLLYIAIAALIVVSVCMFALYQARRGGSPNLPLKWLGFAGMTAIVFGYALRACRRQRRKQRFWLFPCLFFGCHTALGVFVLFRLSTMPLVLYGAFTPIEYAFLTAYLGHFLNLRAKETRPGHVSVRLVSVFG